MNESTTRRKEKKERKESRYLAYTKAMQVNTMEKLFIPFSYF